ncbi:MAG: hypothetical protein WC713_13385 [Candidatus Methylomirabilota bacterium]
MTTAATTPIPAGQLRAHYADVDRLIRFALKKDRAQAYRHLSPDEFADLISWCWCWVLEREQDWRNLDCSLATAICTTIPFAVKSWRAKRRTWESWAIRPETSLVFDQDDDPPTLRHGDDPELRPDALVQSAQVVRALTAAIGVLPAKAREDLQAMLSGKEIAEIATDTCRSQNTVRHNVLRGVSALRLAIFGDETFVRTLEPTVVSSQVRARRERQLRWYRRKRAGTPAVARTLTPEYEWGGRKPASCLRCRSTVRKHKARGLCYRCYALAKREGTLSEFGVILDTTPGASNLRVLA